MSRYRQQDNRFLQVGTSQYKSTTPNVKSRYIGVRRQSWDTVGNWNGVNLFKLLIETTQGATANGSSSIWTVNNYPLAYPDRIRDPTDAFGQFATAENYTNLGWEILSRTNPNEPHVSVPQFVLELKDFFPSPGSMARFAKKVWTNPTKWAPQISKHFKNGVKNFIDVWKQLASSQVVKIPLRSLPMFLYSALTPIIKGMAYGHIVKRWVYNPMKGDILKMMRYTEAVSQRLQYIDSLGKGRTIKRRAGLGSDVHTNTAGPIWINSTGGVKVKASRVTTSNYSMWGCAQYSLKSGYSVPDVGNYADMVSLSKRLTNGFTTHSLLATTWELLPWSWFADWFLNIGDLISATNNEVPLHWSKLCAMRRSKTTTKWTVTEKPSWLSIEGDIWDSAELKERIPISPTLPFYISFPLLDSSKWSILRSLAILRLP